MQYATANQLYPYQVKGVEHLLSQPFGLPHALLADEPGTGKTVMAIEAAKQVNAKTGIILCPKSIKLQWSRQMVDWGLCDPDEIQIAEGLSYQLDNRPWLILNYALVREEEIRKQIFARGWNVLVEDEAHNLKGRDTLQSKAVFHKRHGIGLQCYWKWPLSGSIMPNRPIDLYPILFTHFPQVIHDCLKEKEFIQKFCGGVLDGRGASNIPELTARMQKIMLLRSLQDVWKEYPPVIENDVWLDVPFETHPEWIGYDFMQEATIRRCTAEAKIPYIIQYVEDRLNSGVKKIVVFTFHEKVSDGVHAGLAKYRAQKIRGGISDKNRANSLTKFQQDPDCRVIVLQIMSAGEGLDGLQRVSAEYVLAEPEWSPGREDQARRRILRLGQANSVVIETRLYAARSFEEIIYRSNRRLRRVIDVVLQPNGGIFHMTDHFEKSLETLARVAAKIEPLIDVLAPALLQAAQSQAGLPLQSQANSVTLPPAPAVPLAQSVAGPAAPIVAPPAAPAIPAPTANVLSFPPAPAPAAPPAPPVPAASPAAVATASVFAGGAFASRDAFESHVLERAKALGVPAGPQAIADLCQTFGVQRLSMVPEEHVPLFMQHVEAKLPKVS